MQDTLTAVIDRDNIEETPRPTRKKRIWQIIIACIAALAIAASSTFAVMFYLDLQSQRKRGVEQAAQISSMQEALSSQQEQLAAQQSTLQKQEEQLQSQESTIKEQADTIKKNESIIKEQSDTIVSLKKKPTGSSQPATSDKNEPVIVPVGDIEALKGKKLIALTFDDGPGPYTARLLDALKEREARATFFVVGSRVNTYASVIKRMEAEGHVVGNHSQNHKNLKYLSAANVAAEIRTAADRIKALIGHDPYVMRCPGGNYNDTVCSYAQSIGVPIIQWNVDTLDWKSLNANAVLKKAKAGTRDGAIVLMHDIYATTVDAAIAYIDYLQKQGYTLVTVPELITAKQGTIEAGEVYYHG